MFHEDADGRPLNVKVIDFQMCRPASSGALDLMYYLYICTNLEFRTQHEDDVLRTYFDVFSKYHSPGSIGGFEEFQKNYDDQRAFALIGTAVRVVCENI